MLQPNMKTNFSVLISCLAPLFASAGELPVPTTCELAHEEASTNVVLSLADKNVFRLSMAVAADVSNNVELAFGTDANADGALSDGESDLLLGWRQTGWFVENCADETRYDIATQPGSQSLSWVVRYNGSGAMALSATLNGGGIFANLSQNAPKWLIRRDWNLVKVTSRGTSAHPAQIAASTSSTGLGLTVK